MTEGKHFDANRVKKLQDNTNYAVLACLLNGYYITHVCDNIGFFGNMCANG